MEKIELVKSMHKMVDGVKVYRIRALKSFYPRHLQCKEVKKGDLGGYAQYLLNLSEEGIAGSLKMLLYMGWLRSKIMLW